MTPSEIESMSFSIIDAEAGPHDFSPDEWQIVRRMIHTSADFDYMKTVRFHPSAILKGIQAIQAGKTIVTDTHMAKSGINAAGLAVHGGLAICLIQDDEVCRKARETGNTRAAKAVDAAVGEMEDGIYVVGNAPTALLRLISLIREGLNQLNEVEQPFVDVEQRHVAPEAAGQRDCRQTKFPCRRHRVRYRGARHVHDASG